METTNKISFGFTKLSQKPNIISIQTPKEENIELIDCLEGKTIKLKDAVEDIKGPLVIPIQNDSKNLLDRVREIKRHKMEPKTEDTRPNSELTLDELAAKQLMDEAKMGEEVTSETKVFVLPTALGTFIMEGKDESTLDDYETVPISDYGLAMLRGMGWTEGSGIGKNQKVTITIEPELRPKGMGLGATKLVNAEKGPPPVDKDGKELSLIKGAYAKIIAGKHKGSYCEVLGLDDESGRIIIKTAIKNLTLSLNEFLVQAVAKEEYAKSSKVINNAKYEEYKLKSEVKEEVLSSSEEVEDVTNSSGKHGHRPTKSSKYKDSRHSKRLESSKSSLIENSNTECKKSRQGKKSDSHKSKKSQHSDKVNSRSSKKRSRRRERLGSGSSVDGSESSNNGRSLRRESGKSRNRSRSRSYERKKNSSKPKQRSRSGTPESDRQNNSLRHRRRNRSDSSGSCEHSYGRNEKNGRDGRRSKPKKHRHRSSSSEDECEKRGNKNRSTYCDSSSDSEEDYKYRKHKHSNDGNKKRSTSRR